MSCLLWVLLITRRSSAMKSISCHPTVGRWTACKRGSPPFSHRIGPFAASTKGVRHARRPPVAQPALGTLAQTGDPRTNTSPLHDAPLNHGGLAGPAPDGGRRRNGLSADSRTMANSGLR
jgi:hypothetical protein